MWEDSSYCWVVLCKNHWFHFRESLFASHRIPLGETDAVAALPPLEGHFRVRCDECGNEYLYRPSDVRRYEQELPDSFVPHPLFREGEERRRSERQRSELRLLVCGRSATKGVFEEEALVNSLNAYGALLDLGAEVQVGEILNLRNLRTHSEAEARVVHFGPSKQSRTPVGIELLRPDPVFWSLKLQIEKKRSRTSVRVWARLAAEFRALADRVIVWLRSGSQ